MLCLFFFLSTEAQVPFVKGYSAKTIKDTTSCTPYVPYAWMHPLARQTFFLAVLWPHGLPDHKICLHFFSLKNYLV